MISFYRIFMKNLASLLLLALSANAFANDGVTKDTNINYNEIGLGYFSIRILASIKPSRLSPVVPINTLMGKPEALGWLII